MEAEGRLLSVERLSVSYGPIAALQGVSLTVEPGEIVCVLGANGAGKSTLMRTIAGVLRPGSGSISFEGRPLPIGRPEAVVRKGLALVPEGRQIFPDLTVGENLTIGASSRNETEAEEDRAIVLDLFPILAERSHQTAGTLSGGEQQQLAIGRALMSRPRLLLLDEPSLGLAPIVVDRIFELLGALRERSVTMLLVEQNVRRALGIATRGYVLASGRVVAEGSAAELSSSDLGRTYLGVAGEETR